MAVGKVVKFDETRGFGFIAPSGGTEDVFLHVNDLLIPEALVHPGLSVVFDIDEGGRGLKASNIRLPEDAAEPPVPVPASSVRLPAGALADRVFSSAGYPARSAVPAAPAAPSVPPPAPGRPAPSAGPDAEDPTAAQYTAALTEMLLAVQPPLLASQILAIRERLTEYARELDWLEP